MSYNWLLHQLGPGTALTHSIISDTIGCSQHVHASLGAVRRKVEVTHFRPLCLAPRTAYPALLAHLPELSQLITSAWTLFSHCIYLWTIFFVFFFNNSISIQPCCYEIGDALGFLCSLSLSCCNLVTLNPLYLFIFPWKVIKGETFPYLLSYHLYIELLSQISDVKQWSIPNIRTALLP